MGILQALKTKPPPRYTEKDVQLALDDYNDGTFTLSQSATAYGVPYGTLYGRLKRGRSTRQVAHEEQQLMTPAEEKKVVRWIEVLPTHIT
jgi:hypothetical protein